MAHIVADRVKETTTTTGTGAITLAGAVSGFQAFSAVCSVADTIPYTIAGQTGTEWETGIGTYSGANTLTRTTVLSSSNAGSAVDFSAGTKDVFVGPLAKRLDPTVATSSANTAFPIPFVASATAGAQPVYVNSGWTYNPSIGAMAGVNAVTATPVGSGAGNSMTFTAGSGVGTGAGGNVIWQVGAQATSGGNGAFIFKNSSGVEKARCLESGQFVSSTAGVGFGWAAAGATSITHGLRCSNPGQGYITIQGQGVNFFSVGSNNGQTNVAAPASSANWRFQLVNGTNAETVNGAWALSCSTSDGVALVRNGASAVAGGSFAHPKGLLNTTVTGTVNDAALDGSAFQRISGASTPILTSIAYPAGSTGHADGRIIYLVGVSATATVLKHNAGTGTAVNRLWSSTGADLSLAQNKIALLIYDSTDNGSGGAGWRMSLLP